MALGSTQSRTEISTRSISWGKGGRCVRLTTLSPSCAVVMKSGNLNFLEPSGPLQACNGTALPFTWLPKRIYVLNIDSVVERASGPRLVGEYKGGGGVRNVPFLYSSTPAFFAVLRGVSVPSNTLPAVHAKHVCCHSHICNAMQSEKRLCHGSVRVHRHSVPEQTFQQAPITGSFWMNFTWSYPPSPLLKCSRTFRRHT